MSHALITGPITGRIPHGDGFIDVTPDVILLDTEEEAQAIAESISVEHAVRHTHPLDAECADLDDPVLHPGGVPDEVRTAHQKAHKALRKKAGL